MADHLSDEEQLEVLKKWWKANGTGLLLAIVLVAGGWFGWNYWQDSEQRRAEQASTVYMAMLDAIGKWEQDGSQDNASVVAAHGETLKKLDENAYYGAFGAMAIARLAASEGDLDSAADELAWAIGGLKDSNLRNVITYRLAGIEYSRGNPDKALSLLDGEHPEAFTALYGELRGDILYAAGDNERAAAAYQKALDSLDVDDTRSRAMLELKINELTPVSDVAGVEEEEA